MGPDSHATKEKVERLPLHVHRDNSFLYALPSMVSSVSMPEVSGAVAAITSQSPEAEVPRQPSEGQLTGCSLLLTQAKIRLDSVRKNKTLPPAYQQAPSDGLCVVCKTIPFQFHHFGAFVCNRCRAFFRRCVRRERLGKKLGSCCTTQEVFNDVSLHKPVCNVSVFRQACRVCRYVKCLQAGMNSSSVLSDSHRQNKYIRRSSGKKKFRKIGVRPMSVLINHQPGPELELGKPDGYPMKLESMTSSPPVLMPLSGSSMAMTTTSSTSLFSLMAVPIPEMSADMPPFYYNEVIRSPSWMSQSDLNEFCSAWQAKDALLDPARPLNTDDLRSLIAAHEPEQDQHPHPHGQVFGLEDQGSLTCHNNLDMAMMMQFDDLFRQDGCFWPQDLENETGHKKC